MRKFISIWLILAAVQGQAAEIINKSGSLLRMRVNAQEMAQVDVGQTLILRRNSLDMARAKVTKIFESQGQIQLKVTRGSHLLGINETYLLNSPVTARGTRFAADIDTDGAWVTDEIPRAKSLPTEQRPWWSVQAGVGSRLLKQDSIIESDSKSDQQLGSSALRDVYESGQNSEFRFYIRPISALALGLSYHQDAASFQISQKKVPIHVQEVNLSLQAGPKFGAVQIYGIFNKLLSSQSQTLITAPTLLPSAATQQEYTLRMQQSGQEMGLGLSLKGRYWGVFLESLTSLDRRMDVSIDQNASDTLSLDNKTIYSSFRGSGALNYQAWLFGLSIDF